MNKKVLLKECQSYKYYRIPGTTGTFRFYSIGPEADGRVSALFYEYKGPRIRIQYMDELPFVFEVKSAEL